MRYGCCKAILAAALLSACASEGTDDALAARGASPVPDTIVTSVISGNTIYARYEPDAASSGEADRWVEYYRPDGRYYYSDPLKSFVGKWSIKGGKVCYFQDGATGCGTLYSSGETLYFTLDQPDGSPGKIIGSSTRITEGDAERLVRSAGKS